MSENILPEEKIQLLVQAISHWRQLSADAAAWAEYERQHGHDVKVHLHNSALYERAAQALSLELETGVSHDVSTLQPRMKNSNMDADKTTNKKVN